MSEQIDYVAWWGAIIATLVLIWDLFKWLRSGANITVRHRLNTYYPDGRLIKKEKVKNGESIELAKYCHIELINKGTLPTTIMDILASHTKGKDGVITTSTNQRFTPHFGKKIPSVINSGEVWSCRIEMDDLYRLKEQGSPYIEVHLSHRKKPVVIKPNITVKK